MLVLMGNSSKKPYDYSAPSLPVHKPIAQLHDGSRVHVVYKPIVKQQQELPSKPRNVVAPESLITDRPATVTERRFNVDENYNAIPHRTNAITKQYGKKLGVIEQVKSVDTKSKQLENVKQLADSHPIQHGYAIVRSKHTPYILSEGNKVYWYKNVEKTVQSSLNEDDLEEELWKSINQEDPLLLEEEENDHNQIIDDAPQGEAEGNVDEKQEEEEDTLSNEGSANV